MCRYMSMIVVRQGESHEVLCFPGIDNHHEILELAKLDDSRETLSRYIAKIELIPPDGDRTRPVEGWRYVIDEATEPTWLDLSHERSCRAAARKRLELEAGEYCVTRANGNRAWYWADERHREGGKPAVEDANGYRAWYWAGERQQPPANAT